MQKRNILVTNALPYANGPIHIGHLVGYIQGDIWVRFQRMQGHHVHFICGSDAHGTPIMIKAQQLGMSPEQMVTEMGQQQLQDFHAFDVIFDNFYTTHSPENKALAEEIYQALVARDDIERKTIQQAFDAEKHMFLPDRFVKGTCPKCGALEQYGDNCEACGATYTPTELINPVSVLSGTTPIEKESEHLFFKLKNHQDKLRAWVTQGHLQPEVANKLLEWFDAGLQNWDISRDAPYFGFPIPGEDNKYFYVWLDAPVGYMASFKQYCESHPEINFDDYWRDDSHSELYHFIGKDIIYFHSLFWPAMLDGAGFRLPSGIYANGYLTVNGKKMSKSRGTFISAKHYLQHLEPEFLRYYYAAKLNQRIDDIDLNLEDFVARNNSDLIGKVINIASRCAGFINKRFDNKLASTLSDETVFAEFTAASNGIAELYETRQFSKLIRQVMELADRANQYIAEEQPWVQVKNPDTLAQAHKVCTLGLNCFRVIMVYLKPVLPALATKVEDFFQIEPLQWQDSQQALLNHSIETFKPLMQRITSEQIEAMQQAAVDAHAGEGIP